MSLILLDSDVRVSQMSFTSPILLDSDVRASQMSLIWEEEEDRVFLPLCLPVHTVVLLKCREHGDIGTRIGIGIGVGIGIGDSCSIEMDVGHLNIYKGSWEYM